MYNRIIINIHPMGFNWPTIDPFLFCVHHHDLYPHGNEIMGPAAPLAGRNLGQDFTVKDGWRMYHGLRIPGFPVHPHRGFETVTVVMQGFVDHSDSAGASGRYGNGDVQWMTAGAGLQHCEMFPLIHKDRENPCELFQIWLNLPAERKFAKPHFKMLWADTIPEIVIADGAGKHTTISVVAGNIDGKRAPAPAPDSWAADPENEVAIWYIHMEPGATFQLPRASDEALRMLYFFEGDTLNITGMDIKPMHAAEMFANHEVVLQNGKKPGRFLLLQGRPINEPVVQYGPFVMNTRQEIEQTFADYRATQFGGWPWENDDQVHPRESGRFARYADGSMHLPD
ncbi:MAG TPA: pirin-like C-terminal cupin domain-containing protein [Bacteroidales bacterium]|nr:pirin-like C-terminal cupin domain-containing protein [Bacteroidales bacterium]HRZ48148.1 pirin-like C-terminal cupin domain-containing protein [Bacteroidales bacterium]